MLKRISYLFVLTGLLLTGCTLEQKLAKSFVKHEPPVRMLILEPEFLFKSNLKSFEIPGIEDMGDDVRDSLLLENSLFLKQIEDSVVIDNFLDRFVKTLELYNSIVIREGSVDTMMQNGGKPYIVNVTQFSLEEFIHPYNREELIYDEVFVIDGFDVNAINFNIWIELGRMNTEAKNKVLFDSDLLTDNINGIFKQNLFSGKLIFDYTIDTISNSDIYMFAGEFGRNAASGIYDYILNDYIRQNLSENYPFIPNYYHYDPVRKILFSINEEDAIIELDKP